MSDFLSVNLTATLLGVSLRSIQRDIKTGKYITQQVTGRGGKRYEIALTSLPEEAQAKHKAAQVQQAVTTLNEQAASDEIPAADAAQKDHIEQQAQRQKRKEQGLSEFAKLPKAKKDHAKAKERLLMALYGYMRVHGDKKRPAIKGFCESVNQGLHPSTGSGRTVDGRTDLGITSVEEIELHPVIRAVIPVRFGVQQLGESTLKQWLYAYERDGIIALVDQSSNAGRPMVIEDNEGLKRYVIGFMLKFPLASASKIKAALAAQSPELDLVHERTLDRYMTHWKSDNAQLWTFITHPDKWKSVFMPAYGSHFEGIERLNQLWEMDSTPWDAILVDGRHSVLAVIDLFSRRMVFHVSKTSSAEAVCCVYRKAVLLWGVSEDVRTDNGKDYVSERFTSALVALEVHQQLCIPFASEEKGTIERSIGTALHGLLELLPGFCGHNVTQAQQIRGAKSFAERIAEPKDVIEVSMTAVELQAYLDNWALHVYGNDKHSGLKGRTPNQQAALYNGHVRRISNERALDVLLSETAATPTISKKGIRFQNRDYIASELTEYVGQKAVMKYDEEDLGRMFVYIDGVFICIAECHELTGTSRREVAVVAKKHIKKKLTAQAKELKEFKKDIAVNLPQLVIEHRIEQAENVEFFPRPAKEHSTPALVQAAIADRVHQNLPVPVEVLSAPERAAEKAAVLEFVYAEKEVNVSEMNSAQRWRYWQRLQERQQQGLRLTEQEMSFYNGFQRTDTFKVFSAVDDDVVLKA
jgi:hypothetical protein